MPNQANDSLHILELMEENPYIGLIYIDTEEKVVLINQTYAKILGLKKEEAVGRQIRELTPNCGLPEVLRTKEIHHAEMWRIKGQDMIVTRMPIYNNGQLVGALGLGGLFLNLSSARSMADKLSRLKNQLEGYKEEVKKIHTSKYFFDDLVGSSKAMEEVRLIARKVSRTASNVLITGETGTGKELLASAIHNSSPRHAKPFIRVNCASLPSSLLESELFGYEDGAFTGAKKGGKPGRFELANRGTIFLDEVGDIPLEMQTKLLTFLQEREFERVGGTRTIRVDVRIIAATNIDLEKAVEEGRFRQDLYYRLNVVNIHIPPLRERTEDLPELSRHFLNQINRRLKTRVLGISPPAMQLLQAHQWNGNVRELENMLERAVVAADLNEEVELETAHFPGLNHKLKTPAAPEPEVSLSEARSDVEKRVIMECLKKNSYNKAATAKDLGIHLSALYRKLNKYGISSRDKKTNPLKRG